MVAMWSGGNPTLQTSNETSSVWAGLVKKLIRGGVILHLETCNETSSVRAGMTKKLNAPLGVRCLVDGFY